jgi:3-hydroxyisobutyrate dehydrogenase-like beta-hydroxyacid dehydrogenase
MKLVGNFMVASIIELIGQAYVFAEKRGVDPSIITNMFKQFMPAASEYAQRISSRNFDNPGFTLDAGLKDLTLILAAAGEVQAPLPYASIIRDKCLSAQAQGKSRLDWSVLTEVSRLNAGQK